MIVRDLLTGECVAGGQLPSSAPKRRSVAGVDQENLVDPWLLADRDSRFAEFFGVPIHYKIAQPPSGFEPLHALKMNTPRRCLR